MSTPPVRLALIRHGETDYNREGRFQAHIDIPLNDTGRTQARSAATGLDPQRWALVASSDLSRSAETADLIAKELGAPRRILPELRERDLGALDGRKTQEYQHEHPDAMLRLRTDPDYAPPGGETMTQALDRFHRGLMRLADGMRHGTGEGRATLVVAHGAVLKILGARLLDRDQADVPIPGNCRGVAAEVGDKRVCARRWDVDPRSCQQLWWPETRET